MKNKINIDFQKALNNILQAKRLAIEWDNEKKKKFLSHFNNRLEPFIMNDNQMAEVCLKGYFVKFDSALSNHRNQILAEYSKFISLFKYYEGELFQPMEIMEVPTTNSIERAKLYKEYKYKTKNIIEFLRECNLKKYNEILDSLEQKENIKLERNMFNLSSYFEKNLHKSTFALNGILDDSIKEFKTAVDFIYDIRNDEFCIVEKSKDQSKLVEIKEEPKIEQEPVSKYTQVQIANIVNSYISYLDFMYKKQKKDLLLELSIPEYIHIDFDNLTQEFMDTSIRNYMLSFTTSENIDEERFDKACKAFDKYYEIYSEIKEHKDAGYAKRKENTKLKKEIEKNGKNSGKKNDLFSSLIKDALNNTNHIIEEEAKKEEISNPENTSTTIIEPQNISTKQADFIPLKQEINEIHEESTLDNIAMIINLINKVPLKNRSKFSRDILNFEIINLTKYM